MVHTLIERLNYALLYPGIGSALLTTLIVIWLERKLAARVQLRIGPYYVLPQLHGVIQLLADGVRFLFQELIIPHRVDRVAYVVTPIIAITIISISYLFIPIGPHEAAIPAEYSLLIVSGLLATLPVMTIVMGWASNNKFSLIGSAREALINVSYEPIFFASILSMAIIYSSLDLTRIVEEQHIPGLLLNPLAAILLYIVILAMTDRVPFDLVIGEQEIVAGPYTEYTGLLFGLTMAKDYLYLYALSLLYAELFLAGWRPLTGLLGSLILYVKAFLVAASTVFLRTIYPRIRLDHALRFLWTRLLPLSILSIIYSIMLKVLMEVIV